MQAERMLCLAPTPWAPCPAPLPQRPTLRPRPSGPPCSAGRCRASRGSAPSAAPAARAASGTPAAAGMAGLGGQGALAGTEADAVQGKPERGRHARSARRRLPACHPPDTRHTPGSGSPPAPAAAAPAGAPPGCGPAPRNRAAGCGCPAAPRCLAPPAGGPHGSRAGRAAAERAKVRKRWLCIWHGVAAQPPSVGGASTTEAWNKTRQVRRIARRAPLHRWVRAGASLHPRCTHPPNGRWCGPQRGQGPRRPAPPSAAAARGTGCTAASGGRGRLQARGRYR